MTILQRIPKRAKRTGRFKSQAHCNHVRGHACVNCGSMVNVQVAHRRINSDAGIGRKSSDYYGSPLCKECHDLQHSIGEPTFWENYRKRTGNTSDDVLEELIRTSPRRREIEIHREGARANNPPPAF